MIPDNVILPRAIIKNGEIKEVDTPYELGGYFATIGLPIHENPYEPGDCFNYRRFRDGFNDRKAGKS